MLLDLKLSQAQNLLLKQAYRKIVDSPVFKNTGIRFSELEEHLRNGEEGGLSIETIPKDKTLVREGDKICPSFYIFIQGGFRVTIAGQHITDTTDDIDVIGEVGYLDPEGGRIATVTGKHDNNTVIRISRKFLDTILAADQTEHKKKVLLQVYKNLGAVVMEKLNNTNRIIHGFHGHTACQEELSAMLSEPILQGRWGGGNGGIYDQLSRNCEALRGISPKDIQKILDGGNAHAGMTIIDYIPDDLVFSPEQDTPDCFYIVLSGGVNVTKEDRLVGTIGPLGTIGEGSFINAKTPRNATIRTISSYPTFFPSEEEYPNGQQNTRVSTLNKTPPITRLLCLHRDYINTLDLDTQIIIYKNLAKSAGTKLRRLNQALWQIQQKLKMVGNCEDLSIAIGNRIAQHM